MGSAAAGIAMPLLLHLGLSSLLSVLIAVAVYPLLLPGPEDTEREDAGDPARSSGPARPGGGRVPGSGRSCCSWCSA